jgi:hypothetical protein
MFLRIVTGIRDHFEERFIEWSMAATATYWGWTVAQPGTAWTNEAAWAGMIRAAGWLFGASPETAEDLWGILCMVAGGFWLVALAVNGTFADTVYARHSPKVRGIAAFGSAVVWFQILISVSAAQTSGAGIYPLPLVMSLWCVFNAWRDIGHERRTRHAQSRGA